jgi:hypothetical protein
LVGVGDPDGRSAARTPVATVRHLGGSEEGIKLTTTRGRRLGLLGRLGPVAGLLVLSPIAAEYLSGYVAAPIAVVEALVPDRADRPWLGRTALTVIGLLYLLGAGVVFAYDTRPRGFLLAPTQLLGTAVVVAALVMAAVALPRRTEATAAASARRHRTPASHHPPANHRHTTLPRHHGHHQERRAAARRSMIRSDPFDQHPEAPTPDRFVLQNPRLLRIGLDGEVMACQGSALRASPPACRTSGRPLRPSAR